MVQHVYYDQWHPYIGGSKYFLSLALFLASFALLVLGKRIKFPFRLPKLNNRVALYLTIFWLISFILLLSTIFLYILAFNPVGGVIGVFVRLINPVFPISAFLILLVFITVFYISRSRGLKISIGNATIGVIVAFVIFEFPFTLIIFTRYNIPKPLFALSILNVSFLIIFEILSLFLLMIPTVSRVSKYTLFLVAAMFVVFALWALLGFAYPSSIVSIALNGLAKVLAFAAAVSLFMPDKGYSLSVLKKKKT